MSILIEKNARNISRIPIAIRLCNDSDIIVENISLSLSLAHRRAILNSRHLRLISTVDPNSKLKLRNEFTLAKITTVIE